MKDEESGLHKLISHVNEHYQDLLGYKPEQTSLQSVSENQWYDFARTRGLNPNSSGIYLPRNQTAVIKQDNPLSLFHEYFGHGLYCEQSLSGRKLVDLERILLEEEKQEFQERQFTLEDVKRFRQQNQTFQKLDEFRKQNLEQYESFTIWTEYLLSGEFGLKDSFEKKYDNLSKQDKEGLDKIIGFNKSYGNLATFYAQGLARRTTPERVRRLLKDIYGDKLNRVKFASLYGSRKEFSDIDVFVVGEDLSRIKNDWIDISVYNTNVFNEKLKLFDVALTDALSNGELVFGVENYLEEQKRVLKNQQITEQAIQYNLRESEEQEELALKYPKESKERRIGLSYALTSKLMAENLRGRKRIFTKENLLSNSQSESFIELKGGLK